MKISADAYHRQGLILQQKAMNIEIRAMKAAKSMLSLNPSIDHIVANLNQVKTAIEIIDEFVLPNKCEKGSYISYSEFG